MRFKTLVSQIGKPRTVAEVLDGRTTKDIAKQFGVSIRTAQRWKAGTQQPSKKLGGPSAVIKKLDTPNNRRKNAANAIRNAQAASVGRIPLTDKSPRGKTAPKATFRNVGVVNFGSPATRAKLNAAADALERKDYGRAEQLLSEAVLTTPGKDYGGALAIEDWPPGFSLI
jgi:TolA-binding protein